MPTLAVTYSFSANTLILSSEVNTNFDDVEAVVNALDGDNYSNDSVQAVHLNSDVVRANYGLAQHTDGTLYVDVSDTNPCLEISDGGLRVLANGTTIERTASGLGVVSGVFVGLTGDESIAGEKTFSTFPITPSAAPDADYEVANKKYVDDQVDALTSYSGTAILSNSTPAAIDTWYDLDLSSIIGSGRYMVYLKFQTNANQVLYIATRPNGDTSRWKDNTRAGASGGATLDVTGDSLGIVQITDATGIIEYMQTNVVCAMNVYVLAAIKLA